MIRKYYLLSPGPTPIPEDVLTAASEPVIHHRTAEFSDILMDVEEGLRYVFQTKSDVYILASSGTGAMEAAAVNILSPGDKVITINSGKFGQRWTRICRAYGAEPKEILLEWGESYPREKLSDELKSDKNIKAVFASLSETSTGTVYDIQGFGEVAAGTGAVLVVDGISGLGATPCPMDEWNVDVMVSASQKSFMVPPGLGYLAFSSKAWNRVEESTLPRYYWDVRKAKESMKKRTTPWTPAVSLIRQQKAALKHIKAMGLEKLFAHHRMLGEAVRRGVKAIGLELLSKAPGNILTAVKVPEGVDGIELVKIMQDKYGAFIAGAQDPHKGEFFRIAHLGYMGGFDMITALSALEMSLFDLGYKFERGKAVQAAEKIFKEYWK